MKRIIIVVIMLAGMVILSFLSERTIEEVGSEIDLLSDGLIAAREVSDISVLLEKIDNLCDYWSFAENKVINYVKRDHVDSLSRSIAILHPLAENEDWALFYAEIASIRWQINNMRRSAEFSFVEII